MTAATPLMLDNTTLFIALGHRCSAAAILDRCRLAGASFPFDGIVSKLSVIRDCLETDFQELLDVRHYVKVSTKTVNVIDGVVQELLTESPWVNRHYQAASGAGGGGDLTGSSTYHLQLALTHHDLSSPQDYASFTRKIRRLREALAQGRKKVGLYVHPIMGINDFVTHKSALLDEFTRFSAFLSHRYANICGLFFILVKIRDGVGAVVPERSSTLILKTDSCSVHVIYTNRDFIDANAPFTGDCARELQTMMDIVQGTDQRRAEIARSFLEARMQAEHWTSP